MAHELDFSTGRAAIALRGGADTAWHGFGETIEAGDTLETIQRKAGLNWTVSKAPLEYTAPDGTRRIWQDNYATVRSDTGEALGKVSGSRFHIVQPAETLEFFRGFLSENGLSIETAGALKGGRIVWALANLGPDFRHMVNGGDTTQGYLRMQTAFDGSRVTSAVGTTVRQVCANTEAMIENATAASQYKVAHSTAYRARDLQGAIGLLGAQWAMTCEAWNTLQARRITDIEARAFFLQLLEVDPADVGRINADGSPLLSGKVTSALQRLALAYQQGPGAKGSGVAGTAYGLLNAVTYYVDHLANTRDTALDGPDVARLASAWVGAGAGLKGRARASLMAMAA